jgi:hypothetical protein
MPQKCSTEWSQRMAMAPLSSWTTCWRPWRFPCYCSGARRTPGSDHRYQPQALREWYLSGEISMSRCLITNVYYFPCEMPHWCCHPVSDCIYSTSHIIICIFSLSLILGRWHDPEVVSFRPKGKRKRRWVRCIVFNWLLWLQQLFTPSIGPPSSSLVALHSDSHRSLLPSTGHCPHDEAPEATNTAIVNFMQSL